MLDRRGMCWGCPEFEARFLQAPKFTHTRRISSQAGCQLTRPVKDLSPNRIVDAGSLRLMYPTPRQRFATALERSADVRDVDSQAVRPPDQCLPLAIREHGQFNPVAFAYRANRADESVEDIEGEHVS